MELFDLNIHFPVTDPTWIFFLVLIIILFAPMILGRLRIPHIIGMILAGVVVGKYGFNILERDSSFELFGKVGLYYIMFLAGLEMDMDDFILRREVLPLVSFRFPVHPYPYIYSISLVLTMNTKYTNYTVITSGVVCASWLNIPASLFKKYARFW